MISINYKILLFFFGVFFIKQVLVAKTISNNERIDQLFQALRNSSNEIEQNEIVQTINFLWRQTNSVQIQEKMNNLNIFVKLKKFEEAIDVLDEILNENKDFMNGYYNRAIFYYYLGDFDASKKDLLKVISLESRHFHAMKILANIYEKHEMFNKALAYYSRYREIILFDSKVDKKIKMLKSTSS